MVSGMAKLVHRCILQKSFAVQGVLTATVRKLRLRDAFGIDHIIHQRLRCPDQIGSLHR